MGMPEERPISSSRITAQDVARHSFGTVRRGLDPQEVRAFLQLVAREMQARDDLEQQYRRELHEAEERARHPILDEATLTSSLGQQTAQLLRNAHHHAAQIVAEAEERTIAMGREAQQQLTEANVRAERAAAERIAEAELAAGSVHEQAEHDAQDVLDSARQEGDTLIARARERGRVMIDEAQEARKRVLNDLAHRRRAIQMQIEQLRAARDELAGAIDAVRERLERITAELGRADDNARHAAVEAGQRLSLEAAPADLHELSEAPRGEASVLASSHEDADVTVAQESPAPIPAVPEGHALKEPAVVAAEVHQDSAVDEEAPEVDSDQVAGTRSVNTRSLEELFARIRASQSVDSFPEPPSGTPPPPTEASSPGMGEALPEAEAASSELEASSPEVEAASSQEGALVEQRDALLAPITAGVTRRLKRVLQDEQNRLLDQLRTRSGSWHEDLLPTEQEQRAELAKVSAGFLYDAAKAGQEFAQAVVPEASSSSSLSEEDLAPTADELAGAMVTLLRRRLPGGEGGPPPGEIDDASEAIGAAFREWRGARLERVTGDYTIRAFGIGVLNTTAGDIGVRWIVNSDTEACADCDDNSLAGVLTAGEEFPTGQQSPPAHSGCRCLLAPSVRLPVVPTDR